MSNPNAQRVPKLLLQLNEWQQQGKMDKQQGQQLNNLTLTYNPSVLALADEIGHTPDDELLQKALSALASAPSASSSKGLSARKARPALDISTVKDANATPEAAQADEQESQADALLRAKRMRALKRQSLPEKLPQSVSDQVNH